MQTNIDECQSSKLPVKVASESVQLVRNSVNDVACRVIPWGHVRAGSRSACRAQESMRDVTNLTLYVFWSQGVFY